MGAVDVAEDVPRGPWVYSESLVIIQIKPADRPRASDLEAAIHAWTFDFLARWSLRDGVQLTKDDLYALDDLVHLNNVRQLPGGSVLVSIVKAPSNEAYLAITDDLIATLAQLPFDTSVKLYRPPTPLVYRSNRPPLTGTALHISPSLTDDALARPPGPNLPSHPIPPVRRNDLRAGVLDALIDHAVQWCQVPSGQHYLLRDTVTIGLDKFEQEPALREYLDKADTDSVYLVCENPLTEARIVVFTGHAQVLYLSIRFGAEPDSPAQALEQVKDILTDLAPVTAAACAHRTVGVPHDLHGLMDPGPADRMINNEWVGRVLTSSWLFDAFPVLYLGPGFPLMPDPLTAYASTALDEGRLLVSDELDTWFVPALPRRRPTAATDRARQQLRGIIITWPQALKMEEIERQRWIRDFLNRPGSGGGSEPTGEWIRGSTQEVPRRAA